MDNKMVLLFVLVAISLVLSICSFVILLESHFVSVISQPQSTSPTAMPQQEPSTNPDLSVIPTPASTPTIPTAPPLLYHVITSGILTANVTYTPVGPTGEGQYLKINGYITNNSPNTAYNVGLDVLAIGQGGRLARYLGVDSITLVNSTIPAKSGIYDESKPITDSFPSFAPYQTINFDITIYPAAAHVEPVFDQVTITPVSTNLP
jgi:hypothetical protein